MNWAYTQELMYKKAALKLEHSREKPQGAPYTKSKILFFLKIYSLIS